MAKNLLLFLSSNFLIFSLTAQDNICKAPEILDSIRSYEDITYKKSLGFDLYLPESGENLPLAFVIHGGGWIQGDRKDFANTVKRLASMGYAAATVSYTLVSGARGRFPTQIEDLRCALKTLRSRAAEFSINPDKFIALGQSSGAHLAAELALTADRNDFDDSACPISGESTEIQSVVGYFGPYDLRKVEDLNLGQIWLLSNFLGGLPSFKPKLAELASPAAQINDEKVPFYLVHAADDDVVPVKSSQEFTDALVAANKDVRYVELSEGAHQIGYFDERPLAQEATCGTLQALDSFLRL
ncbi:MAG: alpha/beta hydrolase [Bdellovibrionota bacterium]